jgi:hypothetical protein
MRYVLFLRASIKIQTPQLKISACCHGAEGFNSALKGEAGMSLNTINHLIPLCSGSLLRFFTEDFKF